MGTASPPRKVRQRELELCSEGLLQKYGIGVTEGIKSAPFKFDPSQETTNILVLKGNDPNPMPSQDPGKSNIGDLETHGERVPPTEGLTKRSMRRRLGITKEILERHRFTDDCPGCETAAVGFDHHDHPQACRRRFEECLEDIEEGKRALEREKPE